MKHADVSKRAYKKTQNEYPQKDNNESVDKKRFLAVSPCQPIPIDQINN